MFALRWGAGTFGRKTFCRMPSFSTNNLIKDLPFNGQTLAEFSTDKLADCMPCTYDAIKQNCLT
jgi:hypothetical protein